MKKRRKTTGSRRAVRGGGAGGEAGWKKSPIMAGVLGIVIVGAWYYAFSGPGQMADREAFQNLPKFYMTEKTKKLRKIPGKVKPVPFRDKETGEATWSAYVCKSDKCPWLKSKKNKKKTPYIFPFKIKGRKMGEDGKPIIPQYDPNNPEAMGAEMGMGMGMEEMPFCPKCRRKVGRKKYGIKKGDEFQVQDYVDAETAKERDRLIKAIRAKLPKSKK